MISKRFLLALIALTLITSAGSVGAYTPLTDADGDVIEPNPYITGNVTIAHHGPACEEDVLCYLDNGDTLANGQTSNLGDSGFRVHTDKVDEPIRFTPASVDVQYYGEDTDKKATVKAWGGNISNKAWLDTSNWVASGVEGSGNEVLELVQRNGAHALHFKNTGAASPDADTWTFDFTDITSEVNKLRLIIGLEVVGTMTGEAGYITLWDGDLTGSEACSWGVDATKTANGLKVASAAYLANSTGIVFWDQLVTDCAEASGGISGDVGKLTIALSADTDIGASEVYIYALQLDTKRYAFGLDEDEEPVYNMTYKGCDGVARATPLAYTCLATLAPSFDYQDIQNLKVAYKLEAANLDEETAVSILAGERDDDTFPWMTNYEFTFELPEKIDLTYAGDEELKYELGVAGSQHDFVSVAGTDKTNDVEKKKVADVVVLSTSLANKETEVEFTVLFTDAQMIVTTEGTAFGIFREGTPGYAIVAWLAGIAVVGGIFGRALTRRRRRG